MRTSLVALLAFVIGASASLTARADKMPLPEGWRDLTFGMSPSDAGRAVQGYVESNPRRDELDQWRCAPTQDITVWMSREKTLDVVELDGISPHRYTLCQIGLLNRATKAVGLFFQDDRLVAIRIYWDMSMQALSQPLAQAYGKGAPVVGREVSYVSRKPEAPEPFLVWEDSTATIIVQKHDDGRAARQFIYSTQFIHGLKKDQDAEEAREQESSDKHDREQQANAVFLPTKGKAQAAPAPAPASAPAGPDQSAPPSALGTSAPSDCEMPPLEGSVPKAAKAPVTLYSMGAPSSLLTWTTPTGVTVVFSVMSSEEFNDGRVRLCATRFELEQAAVVTTFPEDVSGASVDAAVATTDPQALVVWLSNMPHSSVDGDELAVLLAWNADKQAVRVVKAWKSTSGKPRPDWATLPRDAHK
jgi:hypothetical protein